MISINPIKFYIDTNILVYSMDLNPLNRQKHRASLEILRPTEQEILCLSSQVFAEFYAVVTSSKFATYVVEPREAIARIERFQKMPNLSILPFSKNIWSRWLDLLKMYPVRGAKIFDLIHIAIMIEHKVSRIYTFNEDDFNWCPDIQVILPTKD